jgi:hypothetical protein
MHDTADLIAETYALGAGPWTLTPVTRGALGQIWKLSGNGSGPGSSWAVKELLFGCDEDQVRREAALREAAEKLGIASPRLLPNREGAYVSHLDRGSGSGSGSGSSWVPHQAVRLDRRHPRRRVRPGRPGLVRADHGAAAQGGRGRERDAVRLVRAVPGGRRVGELHAEVGRAGMPWADALGRFIAGSARELAHWVTPSDPGDLVTSHLDLQPQNVLVGRDGPVLLDWDNAGSASAERELARALFVWSGGNAGDVEAGVRVARAYRSAGGRAVVQGPQSFSMLFATALNYVRVQAECAIDPEVTAEQREFASGQVVASLGRACRISGAVSRLSTALERVW